MLIAHIRRPHAQTLEHKTVAPRPFCTTGECIQHAWHGKCGPATCHQHSFTMSLGKLADVGKLAHHTKGKVRMSVSHHMQAVL